MRSIVAVTVALAACSSDAKPEAPPPGPVPAKAPGDAGVRASGQPAAGSGMHLDDDVAPRPAQPGPARQGKPIDIVLRSTPSGATAAVDNVVVGSTPAYWAGTADGRPHEFTFVLEGHELARYKFVPITSGVIHARMIPLTEDVDAGVPPPPEPPPAAPFVPADAAAAPPPPPTVIAPADAAPAPVPPVGPQP